MVEPREALTPREVAIKDDMDHPLRCMYVKASGHFDKDPGAAELTAMYAKQNAAMIRMMPGAARRSNFLKLVFFEWVAMCVGAEERRARKIGKAVKRRVEFFANSKAPGACRLHLERRPSHVTTIAPTMDNPLPETPRTSAYV